MPELCSENKCTGCGACYNACPKGAISMVQNDKGFYHPVINDEKCIKCGLCEKTCPIDKNPSPLPSPTMGEGVKVAPKVYAFQNTDEQRYKSASGGVFPAFAKYILEHNGIVYGVIWDENMVACHSRATIIEELEKMYSSKYVQSNTQDTYKQAKNDLENGKLVLFSGTPCQIAGLKSYLKKDYENLLTLEVICHGVDSPLILKIFKDEFEKKKKHGKVLNINFRSKVNGWACGYFTTTTTTTTGVFHTPPNCDYIWLFDISLNDSCTNCQFNKLPRVSDIAMCDFWGVDDYDVSLNDKKGTSVLFINNEKGNSYFEKIKDKYFSKAVPLEAVTKKNPNICGSSKPHPRRDEFFEDIKNGKNLKYCVKKYIDTPPIHIKLYRLLPQFAKDFIKYKILKLEKK